jgi:hypothetical protein
MSRFENAKNRLRLKAPDGELHGTVIGISDVVSVNQ